MSVTLPCESWKNIGGALMPYKSGASERNQRQTWDLYCTCSAFEKACNRHSSVAFLLHLCSASYLCDCVQFVCVRMCVCVFACSLCIANKCLSCFGFNLFTQLVIEIFYMPSHTHFIACLWFHVSGLTLTCGSSLWTKDSMRVWNDPVFVGNMPQQKEASGSPDACCKGSSQEVKCVSEWLERYFHNLSSIFRLSAFI